MDTEQGLQTELTVFAWTRTALSFATNGGLLQTRRTLLSQARPPPVTWPGPSSGVGTLGALLAGDTANRLPRRTL